MIRNTFHVLVCVIAMILWIGCTSTPNRSTNPTNEASVATDSLQKRHIDSLVSLNTKSLDKTYRRRIPYPVYSLTDSIDYWFSEDQMGRIAMNLHPDSNQHWPYFWIYKGELIRVRIRKMMANTNPPYSEETMIYLKDGAPIYCEDRRKDLLNGEIPGAVMKEKYKPCTRAMSAIEKDFRPYWSIAMEELKKHNVLPSWIKQ